MKTALATLKAIRKLIDLGMSDRAIARELDVANTVVAACRADGQTRRPASRADLVAAAKPRAQQAWSAKASAPATPKIGAPS